MNWHQQKEKIGEKIKWVRTGPKKKKRFLAVFLALVILAAAVFGFYVKNQKDGQEEATMMEATAKTGNLSTKIEGSGTLTNTDSSDVEIPTELEIEEVKVSVGDEVKKGEILATVDTVSLSSELLSTQKELDTVNQKLNEEAENDTVSYVTAPGSGRVKKIYAKTNTDVASTIIENGSLMLISMDGKMTTTIETSVSVKVGQEVKVTLADGDSVTGTVVKAEEESCTITVTDQGTGYKEEVTVTTSSGKKVGTGTLDINKEMTVTAVSGTVSSILVQENEKISEGESLLKLKGDFQSEEYVSLEAQKKNLQEKLTILLKIGKNHGIAAEEDGVITAVSVSGQSKSETDSAGTGSTQATTGTTTGKSGNTETSASITNGASTGLISLSATGTSGKKIAVTPVSSTAAATTGAVTDTSTASEDSSSDSSKEATTKAEEKTTTGSEATTNSSSQTAEEKETQQEGNNLQKISSLDLGVGAPKTGNKPVTALSGTGYTGVIKWSPSVSAFAADTIYQAQIVLTAASGYYFSKDISLKNGDDTLSSVKVGEEKEGNSLSVTIQFPKTTADSGKNQENGSTQEQSSQSTAGTKQGGTGNMSSSAGGSGSSGTSSSATSSSSQTTSSGSENSELTTAFSLAKGDTMSITVNVDEMDILSVAVGQKAMITLDALDGQSLEGQITRIDKNGTSNGGVTKYPVEIEVAKEETMLVGMNASVSIIIDEKADALLIPAQAVTEEGNHSYVYTEKNEKTGELSGKTEVTTGSSDGQNIEILEGLEEGTQVYYKVIAKTNSSENSQTGFGFGGMGGKGAYNPTGGSRHSGESGGTKPSDGSGAGAPPSGSEGGGSQ